MPLCIRAVSLLVEVGMGTLIMKFGGSSVDTTAALTQVLSIVLHERERWERLILVASALEGVTDALIETAHLAQLNNRRGYRRIVANVRTRHMALAEFLPLGQVERSTLQADIDRLLYDMLDVCQSISEAPAETVMLDRIDVIMAVGERLSARIIAALLRQNDLRGVALDATDLIVTNDVYGNASPDMTLTQQRIAASLLPMLDRQIIPVVTGFVGATPSGRPTTLGRGGSDFTASILATCAQADEVWIWSGVDGMMSSDPREVPEARIILELSYDEVAELAYFGARILHARMIGPLREKKIPVRVKNVFKPHQPGTLIHAAPAERAHCLKAVTSIGGIALTSPWSGSLASVARAVDETFLAALGIHADVMIASQSSSHSLVCFVVPTNAGPDALRIVHNALEARLPRDPQSPAWSVFPVTILTVVGANLDSRTDLIAEILHALDGTNVLALSLGPSHSSLSLIVGIHDGEHALRRIHELIVNNG